MSEITEKGYEDIRSYIATNWKVFKLLQGNNPVLTLSKETDNRVSVSISGNEIKVNILIRGNDSDVISKLPFSLDGIGVYKSADGEMLLYEQFQAVTISSSSQIFNLNLAIKVPYLSG